MQIPGPSITLSGEIRALAASLLIGFLIGAQRESSQGRKHPGVRDFILIALTGAICGLLAEPWLTVVVMFSIALILAVYRYQAQERGGITTEMAAIITFVLAVLASTPSFHAGISLAIGLMIVVLASLEAKRGMHKLLRETITETEFQKTIQFLAIIFVIFPLLPPGEYGPYGFFAPRTIWVFVILVSAISYVGYFLEKFLGTHKGLRYAGVLGGLASTTAATAELARRASREPEALPFFWETCVMANATQFVRVLVILLAVSPPLAAASAPPLLVMCAAGFLMALILHLRRPAEAGPRPMELSNPLRLWPALQFGAIFTLVLFVTKWAEATLGGRALQWASALGGFFSADAVTVSLSQLMDDHRIGMDLAQIGTFLALVVNAAVKTGIASWLGRPRFGWRMALGFALMLGSGALLWWLEMPS